MSIGGIWWWCRREQLWVGVAGNRGSGMDLLDFSACSVAFICVVAWSEGRARYGLEGQEERDNERD